MSIKNRRFFNINSPKSFRLGRRRYDIEQPFTAGGGAGAVLVDKATAFNEDVDLAFNVNVGSLGTLHVGNIVILAIGAYSSAPCGTVSIVKNGGSADVDSWSKLAVRADNDGAIYTNDEIWYGTVTAPGNLAVTVTIPIQSFICVYSYEVSGIKVAGAQSTGAGGLTTTPNMNTLVSALFHPTAGSFVIGSSSATAVNSAPTADDPAFTVDTHLSTSTFWTSSALYVAGWAGTTTPVQLDETTAVGNHSWSEIAAYFLKV